VNDDFRVENYLNDRKKRLETLEDSHKNAGLSKTEPELLSAFELSYNALSEENRKRWRVLGVFPTSFASTAAQAMWETDEDETSKLIGLFRRYSLFEYDETSNRYSLHDLLTDFALEQMDMEERQEARFKHASHYKDVLSAANELYLKGGDNILLGLKLFDLEWDHIRIGQGWIAKNAKGSKEIAGVCSSYTNHTYCINLRLHPKDLILWHESSLVADQFLGNRQAEGVDLGSLGLAYADLGDARKAIEFYEQALLIDREIGDRRGEGADLGNLGNAYAALGDARKAIEFYEGQLVIVREIGDRRGEGNALGNLGLAYAALGDARKAIEFYEGQLVIVREIGDRRGEGNALGNLGNAYAALGDARKAIEFYEGQLVIVREIGDRRGEAFGSWNLGQAYEKLGELEKAIESMQVCVDFEREIGHPDAEKDAQTVEELRKKLK
jgi:tetratricopeptide (TPR) repeat protein